MNKTRKPRTKSYDLRFDGIHFMGQPFAETYATSKLLHRYKNKLCLGCGKKHCECKRYSTQ